MTRETIFADEVNELMLCEQDAVILKPDVIYRFTIQEGCGLCARLAMTSAERELSDLESLLESMGNLWDQPETYEGVEKMLHKLRGRLVDQVVREQRDG